MSTVLSEYELEALPEEEATRDIHEFAGREFEEEWEATGEYEGAYEGEYEWEAEANPLRRVYPDALMEHMGHMATEAESEAEAEAFIGALVPLAAQVLPRVAPHIMRAAPRLIRGISRITRTLRRNPATRPLVRAIPSIIRRTVGSVARQTRQGRPVTPQAVVRALGQQTRRVLTSPAACRHAVARSRALDRRYHVSPAAVSRPVQAVGGQRTCLCCGSPAMGGPGISTL